MNSFTDNREKLYHKLLDLYERTTGHPNQGFSEYKRNKIIFNQGNLPRGIYYLLKGKVALVKDGEGTTPAVVRLVLAGDFLGASSIILGENYNATAKVLETSEICFIPKQIFLKALQTDLSFAQHFIEVICEHYSETREELHEIKTMDVRQRLATLLLTLGRSYEEDEEYENGNIRLSRGDIAAILGISPETLSRQLTELKTSKVIETHGREIELLDVNELIRLSRVTN